MKQNGLFSGEEAVEGELAFLGGLVDGFDGLKGEFDAHRRDLLLDAYLK